MKPYQFAVEQIIAVAETADLARKYENSEATLHSAGDIAPLN
jgi:hypothetical protein